MREKIARALAADIDRPLPRFVQQRWEDLTDLSREAMFRRADAVLEAMHEPTEGMLEAAKPAFRECDAILGMHVARGYQGLSASPLPIAWAAMIDAAKNGA